MSKTTWNESIVVTQSPGAALSNTTIAASLLPSKADFIWAANWYQIGRKLRIRAAGVVSTAPASPGTLTFYVYHGGTAVYTIGPTGTLVTSASSLPWDLDVTLTCLSIGNATNATLQGSARLSSFALSATTPIFLTGPTTGAGFDSTLSQVVDLYASWSVGNASNSIQLQQYELISPN